MNGATVDELLHDASREVRSIMWDVTELDGPGLAAAWPAFVGHAGDALAAVPLPDPVTQLLILRAEGPRPRPNRWGPRIDAVPNPHLLRAGDALAAVADLLERHATPPSSERARREADLVRRRIAECLFVGAHVTAMGLSEHTNQLRPARTGIAFDRPDTRIAVNGANLAQGRRLASDVDALEAHTAHYLARQPFPQATRRPEAFVDPERLPQGLAEWEVTALRVLHATPPSVRDLAGAAHTEQALLVHTIVILNAAARAGSIDPGDFDRQIRSRLENAQTAWGDVAASWPAQMSTPAAPSLAGVAASAQLHRALAEITRDGNGWAATALIAERIDLLGVAELLRDAVAASGCRAERFADLPAELTVAGLLHAPARLLLARERQPHGRGPATESAVRATDVANRRIVAVRLEQTAGASATACQLGRQLTSLGEALETLALGRPSPATAKLASRLPADALGAPRGNGLESVQLARRAAIRR